MIFFRFLLVIVTPVLIFFTVVPVAHAFTFDKNLLITDHELENSSYLTTKGIESFLQEKGSVLASYSASDADGHTKTVAQIIHSVAAEYDLSPMLFLVMAQKESSAITSSDMTYAIENWILGYGRCDGCSEEQAAPYRGIWNQFRSAADRIRNGYLEDLQKKGTTISGWGPNISKTTIDGIEVTPKNDATAALYTYNPCVGAYGGGFVEYGCNSAFQKIWQEWNPSVKYPNGTLLQINGVVYLIQRGEKRAFTSKGALLSSYDTNDIISATTVVGEQYPEGTPISYPNYSLLRSARGTIYMYVNGYKRGFVSQAAFKKFGFNPEEILDLSSKDIDVIPEGKSITEQMVYPQGALLQNRSTGAISYIDAGGIRHDIWSRTVLDNRFPSHRTIIVEDSKAIGAFTAGDPLLLQDGTIVTSKKSKKVFVIANGKKRPFRSRAAFENYGYQWQNILRVSKAVLRMHQTGAAMKSPQAK